MRTYGARRPYGRLQGGLHGLSRKAQAEFPGQVGRGGSMWQDNRTLEDFRAEVDAFLDREWKPLVQGASGGHVGEPEKKAFRRKAIDAGYLFDFISRDYGGGGAEMPAQAAAVVRDAFAAV